MKKQVERAPFAPLPTGTVCLFACYAPDGNLPPYTCFYLKNLLECGIILHIILSGTEIIHKTTQNFCNNYGIQVWKRPNGGLDFGAWQFLLKKGLAEGAPYVLFANDSVFGPFAPLSPLLEKLGARHRPAWGLVASRAVTPHLQSWFIGLSQAAFQSAPVQRVLKLPFADMNRDEIIWHGELGLSVALNAAGFPLHAAWSDLNTPIARFFPTNPMHTHWRGMVQTGTVPFFKQEILRDNPFRVPHLSDWRALISPESGFNPDWIETYLNQHPPRPTILHPTWKGRAVYRVITQLDRLKWQKDRWQDAGR
ncbi:glycosyl transferase [Acetobacter orleanensis]|nr:glycosyl transferase [Acetobacter orleanensis]